MKKKINYRVLLRPISTCQGFKEMTSAELRVLVALIENGGTLSSSDELSTAAGVSVARCMSALTLLSEMGLIANEDEDLTVDRKDSDSSFTFEFDDSPAFNTKEKEKSAVSDFSGVKSTEGKRGSLDTKKNLLIDNFSQKPTPKSDEKKGVILHGKDDTITYEFDYKIRDGELDEVPSSEVAKSIRNSGLSELYFELEKIIGTTLSTAETKIIEALYTQYGLSPEYILTAAAYLVTKGKLTVSLLKNTCLNWYKKDMVTLEQLETYIARLERENTDVWELKRLLGITRTLSDSELNMIYRWYDDYGFTAQMIYEAYNISSLAISKLSFPYMDKIITRWHEAGCKDLKDCKNVAERDRAEIKMKNEEKKKKAKPKAEPKKPRYGSFDVDEAFKAAINRSFGNNDSNKNK